MLSHKGNCGLHLNSKGRREHKKRRGSRPECKECSFNGGDVVFNKAKSYLEVVKPAAVSFN